MGLLDNITGGNDSKGGKSDIIGTVLGMLSNNEQGGIGGLINSFNSKGLGGLVSSWISTGENKPASDEEIRRGMGEERIQEISKRTGEPPERVVSTLKNKLPNVVDKLTPDGNVPEGNLLQKGISMLQNLKF